jgi:type VI secretion system secreted protein VgrG
MHIAASHTPSRFTPQQANWGQTPLHCGWRLAMRSWRLGSDPKCLLLPPSHGTASTSNTTSTASTLTCNSPAMPNLLGIAALQPIKLTGKESLSELYAYEVLLTTPDNPLIAETLAANVPIKELVGKEFTVSIELDKNDKREISGLVTCAQFIKSQDRRGIYQITLEPWLMLATKTSDFKVFQNQSALDIIRAVLADYNFPTESRCAGWGINSSTANASSYPALDYQVQYGESDYAFISRLMSQWGIYYYFEHSNNAHRLILVDAAGSHNPNTGVAYQTIPFYPEGHKIEEEYISHFETKESLQSGKYTSSTYDFRSPKSDPTQSSGMPRNTGQADEEVYAWVGVNLAGTPNPNATEQDKQGEADRLRYLTQVRMQAEGMQGTLAKGWGKLRGILTGRTFALKGHPNERSNGEYLTISSSLEITNTPDATGQDPYTVTSSFTVIPAGNIYRPALQLDSNGRVLKPRTSGPQSAKVTGPTDKDVWTDPHGRVKISFPWNRYCEQNETSSCWVRVASPWSGSQLGQIHIPRVSQEVLVDFEHGDPDRPIIIGEVNNSLNQPSWVLPAQAALGGIRSRELGSDTASGNQAAGRSNHLILDDTAGKIQAQIKSDHDHSQLSLGHITRIEDNQGRKDFRGEGFELRTDGHGAVRAKDGMLMTTEPRAKASSHILDSGETQTRLEQAEQQHSAHSELAQSANAHTKDADQSDVDKEIKAQNKDVKGSRSEEGKFPEMQAPHIVLASPAGIASSTPKTTHQHSGEHHAITSGGHTSISTGKSFLVAAKEAIRMFAYKAGVKLIAASGKVELEAQSDEMIFTALKNLSITSTSDEIHVTAKEKIIINGGGSHSVFDTGGIVHATSGVWTEHAGGWGTPAGKSMAVPDAPAPRPNDLTFVLQTHEGGKVFPDEPYQLFKGGAKIASGTTDKNGIVTVKDHQKGTKLYTVKLMNGLEFEMKVDNALKSATEHQLGNKGFRTLADKAKREEAHGLGLKQQKT